MVRPISLKIRSAVALREARATLRRLDEDDRLRRVSKHLGQKALAAVREFFNATEKTRSMRDLDRKSWRRRCRWIEAEIERLLMANRSYREALALWFSEDRSDVTADNILDQDQCIRTLWHEAGRPALVGEQQQRETDAQRAAQLEQWLSARLEQHWAASIDGIGLGMAAHVNERLTELEEKIDRRFRVIDLPGKANNWKSTASASEVLDLPPLPRGDDLDD